MTGPSETRGDRLAEIEHRAALWAEDDGRSDNAIIELWRESGRALAVDALALVEIAKAAQRWAEAKNSDDIMYRARRLRQALARLDSGEAK